MEKMAFKNPLGELVLAKQLCMKKEIGEMWKLPRRGLGTWGEKNV